MIKVKVFDPTPRVGQGYCCQPPPPTTHKLSRGVGSLKQAILLKEKSGLSLLKLSLGQGLIIVVYIRTKGVKKNIWIRVAILYILFLWELLLELLVGQCLSDQLIILTVILIRAYQYLPLTQNPTNSKLKISFSSFQ